MEEDRIRLTIKWNAAEYLCEGERNGIHLADDDFLVSRSRKIEHQFYERAFLKFL